jgi:hypothetical protein
MSDMRQMTAKGRSIEDGSFAIIDSEAGRHDSAPLSGRLFAASFMRRRISNSRS